MWFGYLVFKTTKPIPNFKLYLLKTVKDWMKIKFLRQIWLKIKFVKGEKLQNSVVYEIKMNMTTLIPLYGYHCMHIYF